MTAVAEDIKPLMLLAINEVRKRTSLGTTTIYRYVNDGNFPVPVKISGGAVRWYEHEINDWMNKLPRSR